jgi:hypothetical protein
MLFYSYFFFELFAFLCCVYAYRKLDSNFKIFLPFLAFVVVYEFICIFFMKLILLHHSNAWSGNIEGIVELVVYGNFMASLDKRKAYRKKVYFAVAVGIAIALADILFIHSFWTLATTSILAQNIILASLVCIYFYNLFNNPNEYHDLLRFPPFLATLGLLLYSLANLFYYATFDYLLTKNNYHFFMIAHWAIEISCGFIYTLLGISFLCFSRTRKLS